jgi:hypothetical protein
MTENHTTIASSQDEAERKVSPVPNWCHNTLTVKGEADELARFVEAVRPTEVSARCAYENTLWGRARRPSFKRYFKELRESQPLSFAALIPQPPDEELRELETYQPCTMCGAVGTLPESEDEAILRGARWYPWMDPAERKAQIESDDRTCNLCGGSGEERVSSEGWYTWRCANWGCKWDASFDGPFLALGSDEANVDETVAALGGTITPTVAIYKFDTAWAPPAPFVEEASGLYPGLTFELKYGEPGEGIAGLMICVGGLTLTDDELELEDVLAPEEMWF